MKVYTILLLLLATSITAIAQTNDKVLARVSYTYTNKNDTLSKGTVRSQNLLLFIGKNVSFFTSYDRLKSEIAEEQRILAMARGQAGNAPKAILLDMKAKDWMLKTDYFLFGQERKFYVKELINFYRFLYEDEMPVQKWTITKDTASFAGIHCQKASTNFEGKTWIAWFAPSLPFPNGPALLNGLPGLIIEAYDSDKTSYYQFAGLENAKEGDHIRENDVKKRSTYQPGDISPLDYTMGFDVANAYFDNIIKLPSNAAKTTKKQMLRLREAYAKDPKGFMRTQAGY